MMKKSFLALAAVTVLLGALSVPATGFAEQSSTPKSTYATDQIWVTRIKGATVREDMKLSVPTSKYYMQGKYAGNLYLYKWVEKGGNKVYPLYQGYLYKVIPF